MNVDIITIVLLFIIGLLVAPFLITVGLRAPKKLSIGKCPNCDNKYNLVNMLPLFPYVVNYGNCPYCSKKIPLRYPLAELLTGIVYSLSFVIYDFSYEMITLILIYSLLVIIFISDFKYYIIQTKTLLVFIVTSVLLKLIFYGYKTFLISLLGGLVVFVFVYIIKLIGDKAFKVESLGGGDVKLSIYFGALLGVRLAIVSLVLGSFLAFPYALYFAITKKEKEIPFGPFLITALFITFLFMEPIRNFLIVLFTNY